MKKTGLILLAGLLFLYLSHGSGNTITVQPLCAAVSDGWKVPCVRGYAASKQASPAAQATRNTLEMPKEEEEQKTELTGRLLHLVDTFARLVMVI